jgi:hypothetical protein
MALIVVSKDAANVVNIADVKEWLRIDNPHEDRRVQRLLTAAVEYVEQQARMVFSHTVFQLVLDAFPAVNWYQYYPVMAPFPQLLTLGQHFFLPNQTIQEPIYPLTAIDWIKYADANSGQLITLNPSLYTVDLGGGRVAPAAQQIWPAAKNQLDSVTIQFQAGFGAGKVPVQLQQCLLNHCALNYWNAEGVPEKEQEQLDRAIIAQRQRILV